MSHEIKMGMCAVVNLLKEELSSAGDSEYK